MLKAGLCVAEAAGRPQKLETNVSDFPWILVIFCRLVLKCVCAQAQIHVSSSLPSSLPPSFPLCPPFFILNGQRHFIDETCGQHQKA
jgi:hypothetical protein